MTKNHINALRWVLLGLTLLSLTSCVPTQNQVSIPPAGQDMPPEITVTAIPVTPSGPGNAGNIEKENVTSTTVSNIDIGTEAQFIVNAMNGAPPKTTGGVKSLSVTITQNGGTVFEGSAPGGAPDSSGQVPNSLVVSKTPSNAAITLKTNSTTVLTATATNFNGQSNTVVVTYVPLDPAQRKKDLPIDPLILDKVFGQNTYIGSVPKPANLPVNGFLKFLNGGPSTIILMRKDEPTSKCLDPTATITLNAFGNLNPGDLTKLFGSETPEFSVTPIQVVACANPAAGFPAQLQFKATYQLR